MMDEFKAWWRRPFSADMDVPHWFAFLVLIFILAGLWSFILMHIKGR